MAGRIKIRAQKKGDDDGGESLDAPSNGNRHAQGSGRRCYSRTLHYRGSRIHGDQAVMQGHWGAAVSANPFLGVRFAGGEPGDTVRVIWQDNQGGTGEGQTTIR